MAANLDINALSLADGPVQSGADRGQTDGDRVQEISMLTAELVETITPNLSSTGER
jgi:hypothetical protein